MKSHFYLACLSPFLLYSCKEKGVLIDLKPKAANMDSTYVTTVEKPQLRSVFIEEFTGASCVNCPMGHQTVASIIEKNPGRIVAAAYHTFNGGSVFKPVNKEGVKSKYDFRDSAATDISTTIYKGVNSIPIAGIDRVPLNNSLQIGRTQWTTQADQRLAITPPANLYVTSTYNAANNLVDLKIKVAYTKAVSARNVLTIGVTESKIIDVQAFPTYIDTAYEHNHVFRKCLTPFYGVSILDSLATKEPGRVYEYKYSFAPASFWNLENCKVIVVLSNDETGDKEVLQAQEVKLK